MFSWPSVPDFAISGSAGDFGFNNALPGIPSGDGVASRPYDSFSAWFDTYIVFPSAGIYIMGVDSDDGFRLSEGIGVTRQVLHINGATVDRDFGAVPVVAADVGGVYQGVIPLVPITAPIVYVDSSECPGPTTLNLTGKIALIDSDRCTPGANGNANAQIAMCQAQGAIAVLYQYYPGWGTQGRFSGGSTTITIPVLSLSGYNGGKEFFHTNGPLTATIGRDSHLMIGEANYGKGMDHQDRAFVVPQAGVYPMHLTYFQGGGGAGLEWTTVSPTDGTRILVNDTGTPGALLAFQARTPTPPSISISNSGGNVVITFVGTLLSSPTVTGPYSPVPGATSPYTVPTGSGPQQFYRTTSQN
jgi:hypothetical protein